MRRRAQRNTLALIHPGPAEGPIRKNFLSKETFKGTADFYVLRFRCDKEMKPDCFAFNLNFDDFLSLNGREQIYSLCATPIRNGSGPR